TPPPTPSPLSLHDALPISRAQGARAGGPPASQGEGRARVRPRRGWTLGGGAPSSVRQQEPRDRRDESGQGNREDPRPDDASGYRSEEHTSELQSRFDLVCR